MLLVLLLVSGTAAASTDGRFGVSVLVNDDARPEYSARGAVYVEAVRGANYALRLTNPMPYRVAVALSVDGLNTIDARHTDSWSATKWVLEPYESTVISGWQTNEHTARRFFFTDERSSYGASLGRTENLGVIEAVFYREREHRAQAMAPSFSAPSAAGKSAEADGYAATGMGHRVDHEVEMVNIDLDRNPVASMRIRYEFHPQLVKLGVLPSESPLDRRERAQGFSAFCPERY